MQLTHKSSIYGFLANFGSQSIYALFRPAPPCPANFLPRPAPPLSVGKCSTPHIPATQGVETSSESGFSPAAEHDEWVGGVDSAYPSSWSLSCLGLVLGFEVETDIAPVQDMGRQGR